MNEFLQTVLTFPTVVPSVLLSVSAVYWLLAFTGLAGGDDMAGGDGDAGTAGGAAAMLARVGLGGVPVMVVLTVLSFTAWFGTYFVHLLVLPRLPASLRAPAGAATLLAMLVLAVAATSLLLRPVRRWTARLRPAGDASLLGRSGVVVTPEVASDYGQASVDDGGAGLILQVRHDEPHRLGRGDRVVLIEYLEGQNAYRVVAEHQFLGR